MESQLTIFSTPISAHKKQSEHKKRSQNVEKPKQIKNELILIPCLTVNPNKIATYYQVHWTVCRPQKYYSEEKNAYYSSRIDQIINSKRTANGSVSITAKRKMNKALDYLLFITNQKTAHSNFSGKGFKFKIAFVTLTLPSVQIHTDNEIKSKCLNQLLIEIKKYHHVKNYIWRAEKQKNGNIHFHIIVDKFINHQELRDRWNRITNKLGYVDRYRHNMQIFYKNGFRIHKNLLKTWPLHKQKSAFERGCRTHWHSPNSTDIHSVYRIKNVKNYVSKYLTKNEIKSKILKLEKIKKLKKINIDNLVKSVPENRKKLKILKRKRQFQARKMKQKGRIWSCNQELMEAKGLKIVADQEIQNEILNLKKDKRTKIIKDTYFEMLFFKFADLYSKNESRIFKEFCQYLVDKFDFHWQFEISSV